jgi:hypothetical protein
MNRPVYCPCDNDLPDLCPACGATVKGDDLVHGLCQAITNRPEPKPYLYVVLTDRDTGKIIWTGETNVTSSK